MSKSNSRSRGESATGTGVLLCPGGLENGGGIGRQMGYFLAEQARRRDGLSYRVVDTRGPWFIGSSRLLAALSVLYLFQAAVRLFVARLAMTPTVVHVNLTGRGSTLRKIVLTTIARALALRYLLHLHDYDYAADYRRRGRLMRALVRGMFHGASRVVVLGAGEKAALAPLLRLPPERIQVLHNAVPDPLPGPGPTPEPLPAGTDTAPCRLVFLGYLSERKGVPDLLHALARPALSALPWRATLAGGGPVETYRRLAGELGLAGRVAFPGWLEQPAASALCADADILVLPSYAEGLAMSVLEGLAHGLAVVATPVGAHAEVIEPDVSGLLVPPGDVDALAAALARVVADPALRDRLRAGARRRFAEKFDVQAYAERLGRLHAAVLSEWRDVETVGRAPTSRAATPYPVMDREKPLT